MRAVSTFTAIGTALLLVASSAHGLGFGRVINATQLGQPLNFAAVLRLEPDESLGRECVSAEVQSGDNRLVPGQIRATLEGGPDSAERSVRVTTTTIIDEPVVTVSVTVGCGAKITRKFVAFVDPPLINLPQGAAPPPTLPPQRNDTQVSPLVTLVEGEKPSAVPAATPEATPRAPRPERAAPPRVRQRAPIAPRAVATAPESLEPAAPRPAAKPAAPRRSANAGSRAAPAVAGPRLKLEAAPAVAATAASAASMPVATPTPPAAVAAAASAAALPASAADSEAAAQLAKERERIRLLEDGLAKLRADSQATQAALATMQARLKQAESERYANPLVYGLGWLSALLALAVLGLLWRQTRGRNSTQWWSAPAAAAPAPAGNASAAAIQAAPSTLAEPRRVPPTSIAGALAAEDQHPLDNPPTGAGAFGVPTVIEEDDPPPSTQGPLTQPPTFALTAPMSITPSVEPVRELSVEELIDLEQQAEFFIVLGQDEAAIELLMSHVRTDGGISPLPYLKLLEIYRRRGESDAYERIRDRFNRRFNAYAPDWESDLQQGRSLEDYPDTMARLQGLWITPTRVMETLDASLFRRNKTDETFDLPAYRELLFLYSVARDLAEHGGAAPLGDVDLLLPLSDDPNAEPISRLSATVAPPDFQNSEMMVTMPLDLDVSFGAPITSSVSPADRTAFESAETLPAALRRDAPPTTDSGFIDFDLNEAFKPDSKKP